MINLLVRTKFDWSWAGGPVLIVRTGYLRISTGVGSLIEISYKTQ